MNIAALRRRIDALDRQLVGLLSRRARYSLAVGRLKAAAGLPLFHRRREQQIARNAQQANRGPLPDRAIRHLFEEILRATRAAVRESLRRERSLRARRSR
jgi:chorismate mutase/prephenate dehydratase